MSVPSRLLSDADDLTGELTDLRHRLHRRPEIGLQLPQTQTMLLDAIADLGLELSVGERLTSITGVLRGGRTGPAVLLSADMDGLPVQERSGAEFTSEIDGAMHACGHDLHMAMLVGAARLLAARREELHGDVVFMFQPGEEGWDGAGAMIDEGVLTAAGPMVSAAYGMHVQSNTTPNNLFTTRPGTMMAASSRLVVTVRGSGGHGSTPHLGRDPISAAAEMLLALQLMVTRRFDIFDPVVLTVGTIHGGTASNIIPDTAEFQATIRSFSEQTGQLVGDLATIVCQGVAAAHGVEVDARYVAEYPVTINDPAQAGFLADVVADVFGELRYQAMASPLSGSEDFSRVLQAVPGCYVMLGATLADDPATAPSNHSPLAVFDDAVLTTGAVLHTELAMRSLAMLTEAAPSR